MLAGFTKVLLPAAGQVAAAVDIPFADLAYYDPTVQQMVLEAGTYTFYVCFSIDVATCPQSQTVTVHQTIRGL